MLRSPGVVLFAVPLVAAGLRAEAFTVEQVREAAAKSIRLLQPASLAFYKTQTCFSCHHQALPLMVLRRARERGLPVDEKAAREVSAKAFGATGSAELSSIDRNIQATHIIDPGLADGYVLAAAAEAGIPASLTTAIKAVRLANWQWKDGHWPTIDVRPPQSHSPFAATAVAARGIDLYLPKQLDAEKGRRLSLARRWLEESRPRTTEDHTFRLLGLAWSGAEPATLRKAAGQLLSLQKPDGGWAQIPSRSSDAYATGEVLVALHETGQLPVADPAWQRGLRYLLESQKSDGSWLVETRMVSPARVSPPYFESGFPYGKNQFLSAAGTSWAAMALMLALPKAPGGGTKPLPVPEAEPEGIQPWMETALFGTAGELRELLDRGLDPNSKNAAGTTLLMMAASDSEKVKLLIDRGADVKAKSKSGYTALMSAATYSGTSASVRLLLKHGAEARPGKGVLFNASPLFFASYAGDRENVEQLKAAGADINRRMLVLGQFPVTPLLGAVWYGYTGLVTDLVRAGADVNDADADGMTGLHWAVLVNRPEMAETLIQAGAKVNPTDSFGYTPALYAATIDYGDTEMLELLIRRGADLKAKGKDGHTALANARRYRHEEIGRVLETAGARD